MSESQRLIDPRFRHPRAPRGGAPAACELLEHRMLLSGTTAADGSVTTTATSDSGLTAGVTDVKTNNGGNNIHQGIHGKFVGFP